jgi:ABC-2 type transport system permease protein
MTLIASLRKEFLEQARTSRLLILAAILLFFGLTSPLLAKYTPEMLRLVPGAEQFADLVPKPTMLDSVAQFVKNINQFGILLALLLAMGLVVQEKEKGTAGMMMVKPLSRGVFLLAKFIALAVAFLACMLVASLGAYYYTLVLFEAPSFSAWLVMTMLMWVHFLVYIALTLLFSTLVRSQAAAAGLGFGAILITSIFGSLPGLGKYMPGELINWGASLFTSPSPAWPALWISLAVIALSLGLAWAIFERQEL